MKEQGGGGGGGGGGFGCRGIFVGFLELKIYTLSIFHSQEILHIFFQVLIEYVYYSGLYL